MTRIIVTTEWYLLQIVQGNNQLINLTMGNYNDEIKILEGIRKGDEIILKEFYSKNLPGIRSLILRNSGEENDVEDVFQDALIIVYQKLKLDSFTISSSIHTYFYAVCKNIWRNKLRKNKKVIPCCDKISDSITDAEMDLIDDIDRKERENLYRKYFLKLKCSCKQILVLYMEGKSMREIAAITDCSEGYARKKKFECKKKLIEMIEQDDLYDELKIPSKLKVVQSAV